MKTLAILGLAALASASAKSAAIDPRELTGHTILCKHPSQSPDLQLKISAKGAYHRDGLWYEAEVNGPVIHSYVFVGSLHDATSGYYSGWTYEAIINRDGFSSVRLEDVKYTSDPTTHPIGFTGMVVHPDHTSSKVSCSYDP